MRTLLRISLFFSGLTPLASGLAQREPTAGETYKNVHVLSAVPASTFMNTMFFQRYALGVSCNFCHVGQDYEKDDKPQKVTARKMLQMVIELNKKQFDGKVAVNCMTCHRGTTKPMVDIANTRIGVQDMLGPRPKLGPAAPVVPATFDEIYTKYIAAIGGRDALAKITNRVMKGNMITAEGAIVPFEDTYTTSPARSLSIRHFGGTLGDFVTGFDGTAGWNSDNRGVNDQRGQFRAQLEMNAAFESRLRIPELYSGRSVTGPEDVGGVPAVVVSGVSSITGRRERLYFDIATGLLVRRSVLTESLFGAFSTDTYYENYRTIDGVQLPTMVSEFTPDFGTIKKAATVEHNVTVDRAVFAKPGPRPPG